MESLVLVNRWQFECVRAGKVVWTREYYNLVPTVGLNKLLDATFSTGLASPTWYVGLISTGPTFANADTMGSHAGWTENTNFAATTRPAFVPGAISGGAVSNAASVAGFTMSAGVDIAGAFMTDSNVKGGTTGVLFAEGVFSEGTATLLSADLLNVTVSITIGNGTSTGAFMPIKEQSFGEGEFHP